MSFKLVSPYNPTFQALSEFLKYLAHFHTSVFILAGIPCAWNTSLALSHFKILFILYDLAQMPQHLPIQLTCKDLQCARRWNTKQENG